MLLGKQKIKTPNENHHWTTTTSSLNGKYSFISDGAWSSPYYSEDVLLDIMIFNYVENDWKN